MELLVSEGKKENAMTGWQASLCRAVAKLVELRVVSGTRTPSANQCAEGERWLAQRHFTCPKVTEASRSSS
jgi:hypothetical protein